MAKIEKQPAAGFWMEGVLRTNEYDSKSGEHVVQICMDQLGGEMQAACTPEVFSQAQQYRGRFVRVSGTIAARRWIQFQAEEIRPVDP